MKHYPVTTQLWRGVFRRDVVLRRPLKAACSWNQITWQDAHLLTDGPAEDLCPLCNDYVKALMRMKVIRGP
jgi:hypothetical protein